MHRIELSPNCSLSLAEAAVFFGSVAAAPLVLALVFAAQGYWPILPIAGLELLLLGWALGVSLRRGWRREYVLLDGDRVLVERTQLRRRERVAEFPRPWVRVALRSGPTRHTPSRLLLSAAGEECEIGDFLPENERRSLARRLQEVLAAPAGAPGEGNTAPL